MSRPFGQVGLSADGSGGAEVKLNIGWGMATDFCVEGSEVGVACPILGEDGETISGEGGVAG